MRKPIPNKLSKSERERMVKVEQVYKVFVGPSYCNFCKHKIVELKRVAKCRKTAKRNELGDYIYKPCSKTNDFNCYNFEFISESSRATWKRYIQRDFEQGIKLPFMGEV